ncbi:MAG: hypothetical protein HYU63_08180 [Armatimonadetes bacterium]|nr:hypothetical protein [Armatimonadota bacterium]
MRDLIKQFIKICVDTLPLLEPLYEFGSLQVDGQENFANLRTFFLNKKYIGADFREGMGVDIVLDVQAINLPSESVGTVIIVDVPEFDSWGLKIRI